MEQLSLEVLNAFGNDTKILRNVQRFASYICKIDDKEVCIKKFKGSESDALFVHDVKQKLKSKGFTNVDNEILTLDGMPYVVYNEDIYVCSRNVVGENIDFTNETSILFLMAELGRLHKCLSNTYIKGASEISLNIDNELERFNKLKKQVAKNNKKNDIDFTFMKTYSKYESMMKQTISDLEYLDYETYKNSANSSGDICFNSFDNNNFIIENNSITFYDFSNAKVSVQIHDVVGLIYRYVKCCTNENVKPININYLVDAYKRNNDLTSRELLILQALLKYPQKYLSHIFKYYEKKRSFVPTETISKLQKYAELEEVYYDYIYDLEV